MSEPILKGGDDRPEWLTFCHAQEEQAGMLINNADQYSVISNISIATDEGNAQEGTWHGTATVTVPGHRIGHGKHTFKIPMSIDHNGTNKVGIYAGECLTMTNEQDVWMWMCMELITQTTGKSDE